jgi:hypothetical protein
MSTENTESIVHSIPNANIITIPKAPTGKSPILILDADGNTISVYPGTINTPDGPKKVFAKVDPTSKTKTKEMKNELQARSSRTTPNSDTAADAPLTPDPITPNLGLDPLLQPVNTIPEIPDADIEKQSSSRQQKREADKEIENLLQEVVVETFDADTPIKVILVSLSKS